MEAYDALIIGAGQAGVPLARDLAGVGWRVALVERQHIGGTCYNEGCTPSKTMAASARVAYIARRAADYGVQTGPVTVDMSAVRKRKRDIVESWRSRMQARLHEITGLELVWGEARFTSPTSVEVTPSPHLAGSCGVRRLQADRIFVNTGARPAAPEVPGLEDVPFLDSTSIMELDDVPEHLVVLGAGYVALEFAQMFRRFGSAVTVIQRSGHVLSREDADVAQAVADILQEDGIEILLDSRVERVERRGNRVAVQVSGGVNRGAGLPAEGSVAGADAAASPAGAASVAGPATTGAGVISGTHLLVATGRRPNTDALELGAAGLDADERGYIPVNERLETRTPGIWALGEVTGGPAFTHMSYDDYRVIRENILRGGDVTTEGRLTPYTIFTDPQLGRVGLSEIEARKQGIDIWVAKLQMDRVARAQETAERRGFIKAVVHAETDQILGAAALAVDGGEIMAQLEIAMLGGVTAGQLREAIFAHPTLAEALNNLFA
jgi:pyruvate/2-oxoglutarate dehydrogenase complex dihydrolipoamide dehydrogenase (E3) component